MTDFKETEKPIEHPLEGIFDVEPGTTMVETIEAVPAETVSPQSYDDKDQEIDDQFQEIYDLALTEFEKQAGRVVEAKFAARNGEIAAQYLNTALAAAKAKHDIKKDKDKTVKHAAASIGNVENQNNIIVTDRNDLLDALDNAKK
jgi:hypothetical protein